MYDRMLLPTDGSAGMDRVVEHAAELAAVHGATLHALYVVDTATMSSLPLEASLEGIRGLMQEEGETAVREVERIADDQVVEGAIVEGSPWRQIVEYGREEDCDVIVMGTHGRGGLDRLLLGSVAERVIRRSPIPVLTVSVGDDATADASPTA